MVETALVFPLLPGKRLAFEQFIVQLNTEQKSHHDRTHASVIEERWFVQSTPQGDMVIVYLKGCDPALVFADLAVSNHAFEEWFRDETLEITGVDLALLPPFCLPQCVFSRTRVKGTT